MNTIKSHFRIWIIILSGWMILCFLVLGRAPSHAAAPVVKQKGMSFVRSGPVAFSSPDADQALSELRDDGADWLSLIVVSYQDTITSTSIDPASANSTDEDLVHAIQQAHSLGMKVMLKPHLDLANDPTHWRGDIGIGFSEVDWTAWFSSYKAFINHYAQLAQTYGADQFCVGTELVSTEFRTVDWQTVAAGVRGIFTGPITYAASSGTEGAINWWDKVDFIGIDPYYALTNKNDPTLAELKTAWIPLAANIKTLSENWAKPILFTELGYPSQDGVNQHPWEWQITGAVDLQEQADLYQALFETFFNQDWFAGIFWLAWETDPFQGGPCDRTATPHDKLAEEVMRQWYGAPPKSGAGIVPGLDTTHTLDVYSDALGTDWGDWSWGGTFDFASTDQVAFGTYAISATTPTYGAVALHHEAFDSSPYYWLEFYVYKGSDPSKLAVWFQDENENNLRDRPVEDCRYIGGRPITAGTWTRVRIPLKDLNASNRLLSRLSIGNGYDAPLTYYVDEVRLVAAAWKMSLPLIWRP